MNFLSKDEFKLMKKIADFGSDRAQRTLTDANRQKKCRNDHLLFHTATLAFECLH